MDIIEDLKQVKKSNQVRQYKLAKHIGITPVTLSRYESDKREMPLIIAVKYADYLGYEIRLLKK